MTSDVNGAKAVGDAIYPNRRSRQTGVQLLLIISAGSHEQ